jgi:hypothetical protein
VDSVPLKSISRTVGRFLWVKESTASLPWPWRTSIESPGIRAPANVRGDRFFCKNMPGDHLREVVFLFAVAFSCDTRLRGSGT